MLKKLSVVALSLIAASAAMAQGLSREQVQAELQRARQAGELVALQGENPDVGGRVSYDSKSTTTREAVLAELQRARAAGEIARVDSESYGANVRAVASAKTRAEVVAELERARASGELAVLNSNNPGLAELQALQRGNAAVERLAGQPKSAQ